METKFSRMSVAALLTSRITMIALAALALLFAAGIGRELLRRTVLDRQFTDLDARIAELEQQNAELSASIAYFQTDTYREEQARLKLGFVRTGEQALTVPAADGGNAEAEAVRGGTETADAAQGNAASWIEYFFHQKDNTNE
jgi:cell division protein FtsB